MAARPLRPRTGRTPPATDRRAVGTLDLPFGPASSAIADDGPKPLTVSELIFRVKAALEGQVGFVWVSGEISNLRVPPSGHYYFTLKDARAQIPVVMFRGANARLRFRPEDGMDVVVHGAAQVYDARGTLQIIADAMEPRGAGALQLALEQLKQKLAADGLFAEERKRPLPFFPRCVGIVTAPRGAAIRDMVVTLRQRMPSVSILVRPVRVQGGDAPGDIVAALDDLQREGSAEVIIVGRGGGSSEDLGAFNDERVARAIAAARVPVVSAVGHEIDWTIADLVADRRAATPTAAASLVVPDAAELAADIALHARNLQVATRRLVQRRRERVESLARLVRDPRQILQSLQLRVDELSERALRAMQARLHRERDRVARGSAELHALSPLAVLERGYAIARRAEDGLVIRAASDLDAGTRLRLTFARGEAFARVEAPTGHGGSANSPKGRKRS